MALTYYIKAQQQAIELAPKAFASGGEGALHQVLAPEEWRHCVAKIIYPHKRNAQKAAKMDYLLANPPPLEHHERDAPLIWVQQLLHDAHGQFVGFLMPRATGEKLEILTSSKLPKRLGSEWDRLRLGSMESLRLRLKICHNIAVAVHLLHATNRYVLVDLKPDNLLIKSNGMVSIVDTDSVEIVEGNETLFAATVATPEYTPSEYYRGVRPGQVRIASSWDDFGLAVIFYRLLFGIHPFAATAGAPYEELTALGDKIKAGLFVHHPHHSDQFKVVPPPHQLFHRQDSSLQVLFKQAFVQGHTQPDERPTAANWAKVIAQHPLLLTERELPTKRLSLEGLNRKNWYNAALEQAQQGQLLPVLKDKERKGRSKYVQKDFSTRIKENYQGLLQLSNNLVKFGGVVMVVLAIVLLIGVLIAGGSGNEGVGFFLYLIREGLLYLLQSPVLLLYLLAPLLLSVGQEVKELLFNGKKAGRYSKRTLYKNKGNQEEWQYDLYRERSRLKNKLRELKNEYFVYLKVKQQKEAQFEQRQRPLIQRSEQRIAQQLSFKKQFLAQQDQQAQTLIQQEATELRELLQAQEEALAAHPLFQTIRGKNTTQKLRFAQQDAPSWPDPTQTKESVLVALKKLHETHKATQKKLQERYDLLHEALLQQVQSEKISIDSLVGQSVTDMRQRIRIDDLLYDEAFRRTLGMMEELRSEIKQQEQDLEEVNQHLQEVRNRLKD